MTAVFADTSYYLALVNARDGMHPTVLALGDRYRGRVTTTEYVLIELGGLLARRHYRAVFVRLIDRLQSDPRTVIIPSTSALFEKGLDLFSGRSDKDWSLTDCISFVVMRQHGLTEALTGDRHFEQAGFKALLLEPAQ